MWVERYLRALSDVALIFPQDCDAEAPRDQFIIHVVPGVPDRNISEHTTLCTKDVVRLGLHLPSVTDHDSRPAISCPSKVA